MFKYLTLFVVFFSLITFCVTPIFVKLDTDIYNIKAITKIDNFCSHNTPYISIRVANNTYYHYYATHDICQDTIDVLYKRIRFTTTFV